MCVRKNKNQKNPEQQQTPKTNKQTNQDQKNPPKLKPIRKYFKGGTSNCNHVYLKISLQDF